MLLLPVMSSGRRRVAERDGPGMLEDRNTGDAEQLRKPLLRPANLDGINAPVGSLLFECAVTRLGTDR